MFRTSLFVAAAFCTLAPCERAVAATYVTEPTHTFVTFEMPHFGTSTIRGRFDKTTGTVEFDPAAKTGKAEIAIDMASLNTGIEPFNKHMQGKEFFDAAHFPTAKFTAGKFVFDGVRVSRVVGMLTLVGKTLPVTLRTTNFNCYESPLFKREVCGGDFETKIHRSQWGITYGLDHGFPDAVRLLIQIEAVKQ